ncbi:MAG: hypothetical protein R2715_06065 [Ilumatobacteraceae bacterium]
MRRLADRYVLEAGGAYGGPTDLRGHGRIRDPARRDERGREPSGSGRAGRSTLVEAATLAGREGETFRATVLDADERAARIQLEHPPVLARLSGAGYTPGDEVQVACWNRPIPRRASWVEFKPADPDQRTAERDRVKAVPPTGRERTRRRDPRRNCSVTLGRAVHEAQRPDLARAVVPEHVLADEGGDRSRDRPARR